MVILMPMVVLLLHFFVLSLSFFFFCQKKDQMECETLQKVLLSLGIHSTLKVRNKQKDTYRIRIAKRSMPHLIGLVIPHMHTNMAPSYLFVKGEYKLGL